MSKYDDRSFGRAFSAFRRELGAGKTFTWRGDRYTTNYAEEPSSNSSSSGRPSTQELTSRARSAIDRAESKPSTRPRARPDREAPVATRVETPEVTTSRLPASEGSRPRPQRPISRTPGSLRGITLEDWAGMSPAERRELGLPNNRGAARRMLEGNTSSAPRGKKPFAGTQPTRSEWEAMTPLQRVRWGVVIPPRMAKGGMVKKGYAKGGMIKANCGASMKPTQKGTKK